MLRDIGELEAKKFEKIYFKTKYYELEVDSQIIRYVGTGRLSFKRIQSLFTKEPTTIPWLESFKKDEVFIDVGANVGMYTIYAAVMTGVKVYSFEPESQNYAELNKNIFMNDLHGQVLAFCLALSDEAKISKLFLSSFTTGFAAHDFDENTWTSDKQLGPVFCKKDERLEQGCVSSTLDILVSENILPVPNHIKIDVDGIEGRVFNGMQKTLKHPEVKSVLIEIDFKIPESLAIVDKMTAMGWKYSEDQVRMNQHEVISFADFQYRMRNHKGGQNFIFYRDDMYSDYFAKFIEDFVPPNPPIS